MSSKLFRQVEELAEAMLQAAEADTETQFYALYADLKQLCEAESGKKTEHPVLWETLADFTEENDEAIRFYEKAYLLADAQKENEYKASIKFSMACRFQEMEKQNEALEAVEQAGKFASFTEDDELKQDIAELREQL